MKKKVIILGATGHVGSYMTLYAKDFFADKGMEVIASGRRDKADVFPQMGIQYIPVDMTKVEDFDKLPQDNVHAVIQLAAEIPAYMDGYEPKKYIDSIIYGTYNVLEYCRKAKVDRLLFSTTCFDVWEYPKNKTIMPDDPLNYSYTGDHAVYVICKNSAIEMMEHYHQEYGLKTFVFRFPTIYSYSSNQYYYPKGVKTLRPIYQMINKAINGEDLECWGDPNYSKDMVHVRDVSQMFFKAVLADRDKGFYNCGTGIPVRLEDQLKAIIKVFSPADNPSKIIYCPDKPSGGGLLMNVDNAKEELGYKPEIDVVALFQDYQKEMELDRFVELRGK